MAARAIQSLYRRAVAVSIAAVGVTVCGGVRAGESPADAAGASAARRSTLAHLDWDRDAAPRGCAAEARVAADVQHLLGGPVIVARSQANVIVTVRFVRANGGWLARLHFAETDGRALGKRELHSAESDCASLDGPVALVIALTLEATRPQATLQLPPPPGELPADEREPPWRAISHVALVGSGGLLPGFALGAELSLGIEPPAFVPVHLRTAIWPNLEDTDAGRGGRFTAWYAGLGLCPGLAENQHAGVELCVGADAGMLSATGVGLDYTHSPSRPLVQARADIGAWVRLAGPFSVGLQAGAAVPFVRPRFVYTREDGSDEQVHRPWPVVPSGALSLRFEVPPP